MSHLKLDLPLKAYKKTEPDESEDIKEVRKLIAEKKWRTLDGRIIPIKQMSISHIKNTINFENRECIFSIVRFGNVLGRGDQYYPYLKNKLRREDR